MKIFKNILIMQVIVLVMFSTSMQAKIVELAEDAYAQQAPENVVAIAEKAAALVDFNTPYEIAVAKKAGVEVNPSNKFIAYNINPVTKNPLILVNPEWFFKIPEDQQLFLLGRSFLILHQGTTPFTIKIIPYLFILLSIFLILFLFWALGKTALKQQKPLLRALIAYGIITVCNLTFFNTLQVKTIQYFARRYDTQIHELVLKKTKDRDAAIKALEYFDSSIKNEIKNGETFWAPYENIFESYAQNLKK